MRLVILQAALQICKYIFKYNIGVDVTVYVGLQTHSQYAGPAPIEEMGKTILTCVGPSGKNIDYLYNLATAMRNIQLEDPHIFDLEKMVRELESKA